MRTLTIKYLGKELKVSWSQVEEFKKYARRQLGQYYFPEGISDEEFFRNYEEKVLKNWKRLAFNLDLFNLEKVVNVGCGIATIDLLVSQYNPNTSFYLVDKNEYQEPTGRYFEEVHSGYNSWSVVEDAISTTGLDRNRFNFLSPDDAWPEQVDLVMSTYSWCWHYPKETYWKKTIASLKPGGKLAVDVLFRPNERVVRDITEEFDSSPIFLPTRMPNSFFKDQFVLDKDGNCGGFYIWTKNK